MVEPRLGARTAIDQEQGLVGPKVNRGVYVEAEVVAVQVRGVIILLLLIVERSAKHDLAGNRVLQGHARAYGMRLAFPAKPATGGRYGDPQICRVVRFSQLNITRKLCVVEIVVRVFAVGH